VVFIPDSQPITQTARKRIPVDLDSLYELDWNKIKFLLLRNSVHWT
jgi:hypothetical protein